MLRSVKAETLAISSASSAHIQALMLKYLRAFLGSLLPPPPPPLGFDLYIASGNVFTSG